ncbi:hypothetical protein [Tenggerimyces flavus]|uniref:Uncharacterized protein n=1 Tax=Tenggerimyces flavus TaxID=1708749 RepID=A0ABV7Y390_9ACTN|nr:hypothetical protein [Tenggerimyces flavus]MBM7790064.1 hypothetical protein [Tenggerimyces flavus]
MSESGPASEPSSLRVHSLIMRTLAIRLFPTGQINWDVVKAAILAVEPVEPAHGYAPVGRAAVVMRVDIERNATVVERSLRAAGTTVQRDPLYNRFEPGSRSVRLIVKPAPDSGGHWRRDF